MLLEAGADLEKAGDWLWRWPKEQHREYDVTEMPCSHFRINRHDRALHIATKFCNLEVIGALLDAGAVVDSFTTKSTTKYTALAIIGSELYNAGLADGYDPWSFPKDITSQNSFPDTWYSKFYLVAKELIRHGADVRLAETIVNGKL